MQNKPNYWLIINVLRKKKQIRQFSYHLNLKDNLQQKYKNTTR